MKRALIYARVSTGEQVASLSLDSQIAVCSDYARTHGMDIRATMHDIMSGRRLDRPGLTSVRQLAANGHIDALIIWSSDRLTRSIAHYWLLQDEFDSEHVEVHYVFKAADKLALPKEKSFGELEASLNEYESVNISERSLRGKRRKAQNGNYVAEGRTAPFGYKYVGIKQDRRLEIVEEESRIVQYIFTLYAHGKGTYQVAQQLTKEQLPTPTDMRSSIGSHHRIRPFAHWSASSIHEILTNPIYSGLITCYGAQVSVPTFITPELHDAVRQRQSLRRQGKAAKKIERKYLLRGLITCSCGYKVTSTWKPDNRRGEGHGHQHYKCGARNSGQQTRVCVDKIPSISAHKFDAIVWNWFEQEVLNEQHLRRSAAGTLPAQKDPSRYDEVRAHYYSEKAKIQAELERFYNRYGQGKLTDGELDKLEAPRKSALARIDQELSALGVESTIVRPQQEEFDWLIDSVARWERLKSIASAVEIPFEDKRRALEILGVIISMIRLDGEVKADIEVKLTGDAVRLTLK